MHARKNKEGRGRGKKEKKEGKRGWDITKRDTCTDDKIKAAASIAELFRWPKIGNDVAYRGLKERPGDLNAFEGAQIAVQSITAKDYGRKGGLIGRMRFSRFLRWKKIENQIFFQTL